jgi:hypothetical protein
MSTRLLGAVMGPSVTNGVTRHRPRCRPGRAAASQRTPGRSTLQLTADDHFAIVIDAVDLKYRLGNVETDCRDRLHDLAPPNRGGLTARTSMALTCRWRSRPQHQQRKIAKTQASYGLDCISACIHFARSALMPSPDLDRRLVRYPHAAPYKDRQQCDRDADERRPDEESPPYAPD